MTENGGNRAAGADADIDWREIGLKLVHFIVFTHGRSLEDAEQVAQDAICRFFESDHARYRPETHGPLLGFLGSIVNGLLANQWRHEAHGAAWLVAAPALVEPSISPEEHAIRAEHARGVLARLRRRAHRDPLVVRLIDAIVVDGIHGPAEQARHLAVRVEDVYEAWRRLREHLEALSLFTGGN